MKKGRMTIANDKRWRAESDEECSIQADTKGLVQPFMFFLLKRLIWPAIRTWNAVHSLCRGMEFPHAMASIL